MHRRRRRGRGRGRGRGGASGLGTFLLPHRLHILDKRRGERIRRISSLHYTELLD